MQFKFCKEKHQPLNMLKEKCKLYTLRTNVTLEAVLLKGEEKDEKLIEYANRLLKLPEKNDDPHDQKEDEDVINLIVSKKPRERLRNTSCSSMEDPYEGQRGRV